MRADDLDGLREVRALGVPLIADESVYSPADVLQVGRAGAADIVSVYVGKSSALERAVESARLAGELGMDVVIGANGEMGIGAAAQLHVACACERISAIPHGIIGHHFYEDDASLADAARDRRPRRAAAGGPRARCRAERRGSAELLLVNPGVQVFLYPEELEHVEPDALAEQVLGLGCDAVSVAVAYHRGRRVFPRHRRVSVLDADDRVHRARSGALRRPPAAGNGDARAARASARRATAPGFASALGSSACTTTHSRQRIRRPPRGCTTARRPGTVSAHPRLEAVEYVAALAGDVAAQLGPDAVDLEAAFYPAWEPSYTLTLALEPLTDEEKLLWAQCSCPACLAMPDRAEGARRLIDAAAGAVHAQGSLLRVFASGPPEQAALQGVSPDSVAAADALLYGCGPLRGDELLTRFDGLRGLAGRPGTVSTNWTPERTDLAADVERLAAAGAEGLALYNLSLVPEAGLEAFRAAAAAFKSAVPA